MKKFVACTFLFLIALLAGLAAFAAHAQQTSAAPTGTLETFIVARGTIAIDLDVQRRGH